VLTLSPDSGTTLRRFDAADRLVAMTDAQGNTARYEHDPQGRILKQTIADAKAKAKTQADRLTPPTTNTITTEWRYSPRHLLEVIHPTQRERFEVDARGLRTARIVTLITPQGELTSVTRYEHDETGQLVASTLPDGSRLVYERNGQNQVVALKRQTIQTPWLRWLGTAQTLASGFERDLVGLSGYTSGNGIEARYLRSASGDLARVVYRHTQLRAALQARHGNGTQLMGRSTQETIERLLGIAPAHAQAVVPPAPAGSGAAASPTAAADLPGALGSPADPQALIDHRYLWSAGGHLLHSQQRAGSTAQQTQHSHAYNARGQLVASVQASLGAPAQSSGGLSPVSLNETAQAQEAQEQSVWRYAYDASQRRMLSQQGVVSQSDISTATQRSQFQDDSHRLSGSGPGNQATTYNANGQPERVGSREYVWDALGRLIEVREETRPIARYQYDHRGLRVGKQVGQSTTHTTTQTLYDESRQTLAELDAQGRITRQYIWLADLPLAVIDTPQGQALATEAPGLSQLWADVRSAINSWLRSEEGTAWLHTNHLGAPEAATNAQGQLVWRARYAPFGAAQVSATQSGFTLHLRLPGQVWDEETGLHYNRQRYYDPEHGQYLTPDPLGTPDGPNPYAYVAFNPLGFIDPDGLILFAFDGTGNSDVPLPGSSISNVVQFRNIYADNSANRAANYVTGVGTDHRDTRYGDIISANFTGVAGQVPDRGGNYSGPARIERMMLYMRDEADAFDNTRVMNIDIVGFSRGAAQARDFANRLAANAITQNGRTYYRYTNAQGAATCQWVNFRFMGLWDTVLSTNRSGTAYNMAIPAQFRYVAHAVALNEYRSAPDGVNPLNPLGNFRFWDDTRIHLDDDDHYGGFPLQSIGASSNRPGQMRIERGFIGAHADIGGGYAATENSLSLVALNWMVGQAQIAGVNMRQPPAIPMNSPVQVHDQSNVIRFGDPRTAPATFEVRRGGPINSSRVYRLEDRVVAGAPSGTTQRTMGFGPAEAGGNRSMTNADTHQFITYTNRRPANIAQDTRPTNEIPGLRGVQPPVRGVPPVTPSNVTGTVDMQSYMSWLRSNGYVFTGTNP
jgi:RHS repeat-associated protein